MNKIPEVTELNEKIALDFAGPFQDAKQRKKCLLVSLDHISGRPGANFFNGPTPKNLTDFLKHYVTYKLWIAEENKG